MRASNALGRSAPWWGESAQRRQNFRNQRGQTMALIMTEQELNGITVVGMKGEIVLGEESNAFREKIKELLMAGKKKIVLNVANVNYIDSTGVGVLVACFNSARSHDAALKLANVWSRFREVLQMTRLLTVFDTYDSESAAIQSFAKSLRTAG
ncbi:MAG: anti-sigma factor antagonist [Acidobacteria bacterium]|nr:MAG: anti-sigma factor antagonist [Acidobacteriota bacterium]